MSVIRNRAWRWQVWAHCTFNQAPVVPEVAVVIGEMDANYFNTMNAAFANQLSAGYTSPALDADYENELNASYDNRITVNDR